MKLYAGGKIYRGEVAAIKDFAKISSEESTPRQAAYFASLLKELRVQPKP